MSFIAFRGLFSAGLKIGVIVATKLETDNLKIANSVRTSKTYHFANPGFCTNPALTYLLTAPTTSPQWIHQDAPPRALPAPKRLIRR